MTVGATLALSNLSLKGCGPGYPWYTASLSNHTVVSQNPKDKHVAVDLARLQRELLVSIYVCSMCARVEVNSGGGGGHVATWGGE